MKERLRKMHIKNRAQVFFFTIAIIIASVYFIYRRTQLKELENDGVYVLAQIHKTMSLKNGISYSCSYFFKGTKYAMHFSGIGLKQKVGGLVYIKILPTSPEVYDVLNQLNYKVPGCLRFLDSPYEGWKEIPKDTCK